jgi:flagellar hook-associated protein 2
MSTVQFSGLASGIDSGALIDAVIESRQIRNDIRKRQIAELQSETESLVEFKTKLTTLNDLLDKFRTANGGGVSKKATSSDNSVATAVSASTANNASYSLTVTSIANNATGSFDNTYSSKSDALSTESGKVTITVGTGANEVVIEQDIVANTTTLDAFVASFNAKSQTAGKVFASAVNVGSEGSPQYKLMFTTLESGTAKGNLSIASDTTDMPAATVSQAENAEFSIAGIGTITRSSNTISDVIGGVSFNLNSTGTTTIGISNDPDKSFSEVQEFVDAYNDIVKYINENNKVERVESGNNVRNVFGTLARTRVDRDFISLFRNQMSSATSTAGQEVKSLAQMGIVTNRDGTLTLREDEFKSAVQKDIVGATGTLNNFADKVAGIGGSIYQYTKFNGMIDIAMQSNNNQIESISRAIAQLDRQTDKIRQGLTLRFANLESTTGRLQSQQQALTGILAGLTG